VDCGCATVAAKVVAVDRAAGEATFGATVVVVGAKKAVGLGAGVSVGVTLVVARPAVKCPPGLRIVCRVGAAGELSSSVESARSLNASCFSV
jgi:hypothetical protein